jgi:hypothetical protein
MNLVNETRFSVEPDNMEIQTYTENATENASSPPLSNMPHPIKELRQARASSDISSKLKIGTTRCVKRPTKFDLQNTNGKRNPMKWKKIGPKIFTPSSRT